MAKVKISELPSLTPATLDTTYVVGVSGSTTYKISINQLTSSLDTTFATDLVTAALSSSLNSKLSTSSYSTDSASFNSRIISGSVVAGTISSSAQISGLGFITASTPTDLSSLNTISASYLSFTQSYYSASASFDSRVDSLENATSSYLTSLNGAISSSTQVLNGSGIFSSSAQLPTGLISSSTQFPSNLISGSSQISTLGYATTGSNVFSGSQTITGSLNIVPTPPSIGDSLEGGKVAYILQSGDTGYDPNLIKGIIAATSDQSTIIPWYNGVYITTSATGTAIGTGLSNTNTIITSQGATSTDYAAGLARAYGGGGYSDWYLPSKDELNQLYINRVAIGGFTDNYYWSSTEVDSNLAWYQFFDNGSQSSFNKFTTFYVRAIRTFSIQKTVLTVVGDTLLTGSLNISGSAIITGSVSATSFNGTINATNGVISGSSQLTSSYDTRYTLSGSVQPLPSNLLSSSAQISALGYATTSSVTTISASAWGAFQSASSYSSSLQTSITTLSSSVDTRLDTLEASIITGSPNYVQVLGNQRVTSTPGTSIISGSITTSGNPVQIIVTGDANPTAGAGQWCTLQIYRDNSAIGGIVQVEAANSNENQAYCVNVIDTPSAGTYTYSLRMNANGGGNFQFGESSGPLLTAVELNSQTSFQGITLISGSSQLTSSYDARYLTIVGDSVISGSSQLTSSFDTRYAISASFVSSSNVASIQTITSASYAALTPVSGTLYIIIG